jgi:hypothetical protein
VRLQQQVEAELTMPITKLIKMFHISKWMMSKALWQLHIKSRVHPHAPSS